jgi:uncharacterized protein
MPGALLKVFLGEAAVVVTMARCVMPKKALDLGYTFHYPDAEAAIRNLLHVQ